jgi:hypothetical protein
MNVGLFKIIKKHRYLILLLLAFASSCAPPKAKNDLTKDNLKGSIKSIKESFYPQTGDLMITSSCIAHYNKQGFLDSVDRYDCANKRHPYYSYKYDKNGQLIESRQYALSGINYSHCLFDYNIFGNVTDKWTYDEGRALASKITYKYDYAGNETEEDIYLHQDTQITNKSMMKYNDQGYLSEYTYYRNQKIVDTKKTYKYDSDGHQIEIHYYYYPDSNEAAYSLMKYDQKGNVIQEIYSRGATPSQTKYKYVYDSLGNWIKRTIYRDSDSIATDISLRNIEYY